MIYDNGIYREETPEELTSTVTPKLPYAQRVVNRIRTKYSVDDELAILRQRDTKPKEFAEYNAFVEQIKAEEKDSAVDKQYSQETSSDETEVTEEVTE